MEIWTDGSCPRNGARNASGGWAFVADDGTEVWGRECGATNNRMELRAVIEALAYARKVGKSAVVYSDSMLTVNGAKGLWKRKANRDMWEQFESLVTKEDKFFWVRGHAGNINNDRADVLCGLAATT